MGKQLLHDTLTDAAAEVDATLAQCATIHEGAGVDQLPEHHVYPTSVYPLAFLTLTQCSIDGPIPRQLFTGRAGFALVELDLGANNLEGEIPGEAISQCTNLMYLDLHENLLTGIIPDLRRLKRLKVLNLSWNGLHGTIPDWLFTLPCLARLSLQSQGEHKVGRDARPALKLKGKFKTNRFEGPLPDTVGSCKTLAVLNISRNDLSGPLPVSIRMLEGIEKLAINGNEKMLRAKTGVSLVDLFSPLHNLKDLGLPAQLLAAKGFASGETMRETLQRLLPKTVKIQKEAIRKKASFATGGGGAKK